MDGKRRPSLAARASWTYVVLAVIVAAALVLRLKSAWFAYPLTTHPDERTVVAMAGNMLRHGDPNPHFFNYPSLVIYLQAATMIVVAAFKYLVYGTAPTAIPRVDFYVAGRIVASLAAVASIGVTFLAGRRLFDARVGLFAAAVTAISPLHVHNSALVTTDIWVATFSTFVLFHCAKMLQHGAPRDYVLAGVFVGLAAGAKYTAVTMFAGVIAAHLLSRPFAFRALFDRKLLVSGACTAITFVVTTPYAILDTRTFLSHVAFESLHYRTGHAGDEAAGSTSWSLYADALLSSNGLGPVVVALALIGCVLALRKPYRPLLVVLAIPVALFSFVGSYKVFFDRNVVGTVPALSIAAGVVILALSRRLPRLRNAQAARSLLFAVTFLIAAAPLASKVLEDVRNKGLPDTRWVALSWIAENIAAGARVAVEGYGPPVAEFDRRLSVTGLGIMGLVSNGSLIDASVDYVILSSYSYGRFFDPSGAQKDRYRSQAQIYSEFFADNELVYELRPQADVLAGPVIRVFRNSRRN